jgi:hypothetical protein
MSGAPIPTEALRARCEDEVFELHRFFQGWYRGEVDAGGEAFSRVSDVLGEGFHLISPDGTKVGRSDLLASIRGAHGSKPADFVIRTEDCHFRAGGRGLGVVTYEEWHEEGGTRRGRVSTAVFQDRADAPQGVEWVHVHETWLT